MKILIKIILMVLILGVTLGAKDVATVTALNAKAFVQRDGSKIELSIGDKLQPKDTVITDSKAKVQIIFKDKTVVTVGKNSIFSIDDYLFEEGQAPVVKFGMLKGAMRTITGSIGKIAPEKFSVVTKSATIGIRGTNFSVVIAEDNTHNIYCTYGAISVEFDGKVYLVRQSFYITISVDGKVEIREFKPQDIKDMKEKNFGKSVPREGLANNEGLIDNIKEYDSEIVIKKVEMLIEDANNNDYYTPTANNVIAGYQMSNADYDGSYSIDNTNGTNLIDGGFASLHVDFGADVFSLRLFDSFDNSGNVEINYDILVSGADTNSFEIERPNVSVVPYGNADGNFYGATGNTVNGDFYYNDGNTQFAEGSYTVTTPQVLH